MNKTNHRWEVDPIASESPPPPIYKVSCCIKCGITRLHIFDGKGYRKEYSKSGQTQTELPPCITKNQ